MFLNRKVIQCLLSSALVFLFGVVALETSWASMVPSRKDREKRLKEISVFTIGFAVSYGHRFYSERIKHKDFELIDETDGTVIGEGNSGPQGKIRIGIRGRKKKRVLRLRMKESGQLSKNSLKSNVTISTNWGSARIHVKGCDIMSLKSHGETRVCDFVFEPNKD